MITHIPFHQENFPFLEIETENSPHLLLDGLSEKGLAIIGTRYPQHRSFELLEKTMQELRGSELVIVSGFARGIDSRAHELALDHGLKTVAILGCGLNVDYPRENRYLRKRILESGGMILSPFERDAPAYAGNFLKRNRLIAFFSKAVWVVEAGAISGTLNTAKHASELNRDLYATSCFPNDRYFEGNEKLLSQQRTDQHPIADPFFNTFSLCKTWGHLQPPVQSKKPFIRQNASRIQRWVLEIREAGGDCHLRTLSAVAINSGVQPSQFYREYLQELNEGKIKEDLHGRVSLA
jgi:DNA protecting protein DprA